LVHRDIKPANVLLRRRAAGTSAYLGDFGVACRHGADAPADGGTVGTPQWMAPELHAGGQGGMAADIYALGCVLWATLTGRSPYDGSTEDQVVAAHREQPVPQLKGPGPLVKEVNRILRRTMAKNPALRHRSAAELRDDLRRTAKIRDFRVRPVPAGRWATVAAVLGAVAASIGLATWSSGDDAVQPRSGERAHAVASLARALADQGVMTRPEARCTARRWIAETGLGPMLDAGFFDADLSYVDRDRAAMTPRIERAAINAARICAAHRRKVAGDVPP
jgi:serine/threonine-protein kinase